MTVSALTLEQAAVALARFDKAEGLILAQASPHEAALMLEAKYFADAKIGDSSTADANHTQEGGAA